MNERATTITVIAVLFASAVTAWASGTMQKAPSGQMQKAPVQTDKKFQTAPAIKVEAQALTVTVPPSNAPTTNLTAGTPATVTFTFKNTGTGTVAKVPWSIHLATGNQTLAEGEKPGLEPGGVFTATASWTPTAGQKLLQGYVDPSGKALKNRAPVAAQIKELTVNVATAPAATQGAPAERETRVLEHAKAKASGANFTAAADGATPCVIKTYAGDAPIAQLSTAEEARFYLDCKSSPFGGRANYDLYSNFRLKNGWKVVRVDPRLFGSGSRNYSWQAGPPGAGSDNPYMRIHLFAEAGGYADFYTKVTIEGPKGTDPYQ